MSENNSGQNLPDEQSLLDEATDVPLEISRLRPPSDGPFWRLLDKAGPFLPWAAAAVMIIVFTVATAGGPDLAWVANFYLLALVLFILYIPFMFRRHRREEIREASYRLESYRNARAKMARMILEQSHQPADNTEKGPSSKSDGPGSAGD